MTNRFRFEVRLSWAPMAALSLVLVLPAAASAGQVSRTGVGNGTYVYEADPGGTDSDQLDIRMEGANIVFEEAALPLSQAAGTGCTLEGGGRRFRCPAAGITRVSVRDHRATFGTPQRFTAQSTFPLPVDMTSDAPGGTFTVAFTGGAGDDSLSTCQFCGTTFVGNGGDDSIAGSSSRDVITPGPGSDIVVAGDGDDEIQARDGAADSLGCGPGVDSVVIDTVDFVNQCESVDRPAPPASPPASPPAAAPVAQPAPPAAATIDRTRPILRSFAFADSTFKVNKRPKVSFTLSEPSSVKFTAERESSGRRVSGRCKARTRANRNKPKCTLRKPVAGSFTITGKAGRNTFTFPARIGGKRLSVGSYRLNGRATDRSRNASELTRMAFAIVK